MSWFKCIYMTYLYLILVTFYYLFRYASVIFKG